jgi:hypothetical protein
MPNWDAEGNSGNLPIDGPMRVIVGSRHLPEKRQQYSIPRKKIEFKVVV